MVPAREAQRHFSVSQQLSKYYSVQFSSVAQSCPTLCNPWTAAQQASLSITNSQSLLKFMSIKSVMSLAHSFQNVASQTQRCESYSLNPHSECESWCLEAGSHSQLHPGPRCPPSTQCRNRLSVPDKTFSPGCECL